MKWCRTQKTRNDHRDFGGVVRVASGCLLAVVMSSTVSGLAYANGDTVLLQSTTSTRNSGLYDYLLPRLKAETGITANVVAVGTGQAIRNARNCDADILLVHARHAEEKFVADGFGVERLNLMYNDFVIVGPAADPAGIDGVNNVGEALRAIADTQSFFASRGDDSGTHQKEIALWRLAGIDPGPNSGHWYLETGSGMGATLNLGVGKSAYVLTDRATWIAFANKGTSRILLEGSDNLFNQYGVILVAESKCPNVKTESGRRMIAWLTSASGQRAIAGFNKDGQQLFFPNASP